MGWTNDQTDNLTLPPGGNPNDPHIVIGPHVPATLSRTNFTFTGAVIWYFDASAYYFEASATYSGPDHAHGPCEVTGTYDPINGLVISEINWDPQLAVDKEIWMGDPNNTVLTTYTYNRCAIDMTTLTGGDQQFRIDGNLVVPLLPGRLNQQGGAVVSSTSTTYVTLLSFTFVKRYDTTQVQATVGVGGYFTGAVPSDIQWGIRINGVTADMTLLSYEALSTHKAAYGVETFGGGGTVPAGTYTVNLRWKRAFGTGTMNWDVHDWLSASMIEVN